MKKDIIKLIFMLLIINIFIIIFNNSFKNNFSYLKLKSNQENIEILKQQNLKDEESLDLIKNENINLNKKLLDSKNNLENFKNQYNENLKINIDDLLILLEDFAIKNNSILFIDYNNICYSNQNTQNVIEKNPLFENVEFPQINGINIMAIPLNIKGDFNDLCNFIKELENTDKIKFKQVKEIYINKDNINESNQINCDILFYIYYGSIL